MSETVEIGELEIELPTVLSNSALNNAVIAGAKRAAEELGEGYFAVVQTSLFNKSVCVFEGSLEVPGDLLDLSLEVNAGSKPIWSLKLEDFGRHTSDLGPFFKVNPPRYFFLTEEDARAHIEEIQQKVIALVTAAAEKTTEEEVQS